MIKPNWDKLDGNYHKAIRAGNIKKANSILLKMIKIAQAEDDPVKLLYVSTQVQSFKQHIGME